MANKFSELIEYLDKRFAQIDERLYGLAKITLDNNQELKVLNHRTDRLEGWAKKASPKIGVKFSA